MISFSVYFSLCAKIKSFISCSTLSPSISCILSISGNPIRPGSPVPDNRRGFVGDRDILFLVNNRGTDLFIDRRGNYNIGVRRRLFCPFPFGNSRVPWIEPRQIRRDKSLCFIIDGFTMFLFFFGLLFLGDAFSRGRPLPLWSVAFSVLFAISLFASWIAFRPKALQRAVKIVGFDSSMQNVLLAFENKSYQEAVLQENPMASELISWIIKPGS